MTFPISLLFASTTKGHFGRQDIYEKALEDWKKQGFLDLFRFKRGHIKDGEEQSSMVMRVDMEHLFGFDEVLITEGSFKHFDPSHPIGQLQDLGKLLENINTPYIFFLEDDFLVRPLKSSFEDHIESALTLLNTNPNVSQVRIPRESDSMERYKTIHNVHNGWQTQNDIFSFNPYIARTTDIMRIYNSIVAQKDLIFDLISRGQLNAELVFTQLARQMCGDYSFYSFDKNSLLCYHIGTKIGEEDKIK